MKQVKTVNDNQNPRASIGILCPYIYSFFLFEHVYKNLENVEFVLDFTTLPIGMPYPGWYKKKIRTFFVDRGVYFRDFEESELAPDEFFSKYHTLVGDSFSGFLAHHCNRTKKKVRVLAGLAKDLDIFTLTNTHFDLIVCSSEYIAKKMQGLYGVLSVSVTGDPKYDRYLLHSSEQSTANNIIVDSSRKNILFAPTWGNLSSEEKILPALVELSKKYTVFYKPHHMTMISRPDLIRNFQKIPNISVIDDAVSFMDILKKSDVVITDNSSAIFDAIIVKKPLVLVDITIDGKFPYKGVPFFSFRQGKLGGVSTSSDSLEQVAKKEDQEIAPVVHSASKLIEDELLPTAVALESAIESANDLIFLERQEQVRNNFLGRIDGKAGERIASEIQNMIEHYREDTRSILEQYVYDYQNRVREEAQDIFEQEKKNILDEQKISDIRRLPKGERMKKIVELFY